MRLLEVVRWRVVVALLGSLWLSACGADDGNPAGLENDIGNTVVYGDAPQQFAIVRVPDGEGPHPVVVLVHGGFWRSEFGLDLMEPLADDLIARGYATWNLEYRRIGDGGGGYPGTLVDVADGVDALASVAADHDLDLDRVAVVGHSAGGHLALWAGSRSDLPEDAPGGEPAVTPKLVVGLAPVADLVLAAEVGLGGGATQLFLGGEPVDRADVYAVAQPDLAVTEAVLVHGEADTIVPPEQSTRFADVAEVIVVSAEDHFDVIDPASESWVHTIEVLRRL